MQHGILRANLCGTEFYGVKFHVAWNLWRRKIKRLRIYSVLR